MLGGRILLLFAATVRAFAPQASQRARAALALRAGAGDPILDADNWQKVKDVLDELPVVISVGKLIQPRSSPAPTPRARRCSTSAAASRWRCFTPALNGVEACKEELKLAIDEWPQLELDIVPFRLGEAFMLHRQGSAVLIPSKGAVVAAGAPPEADPMGQEVPLFCCMEMAREGPNGQPQLPLFLSHGDAKAAIDQATAADGGGEKLDLVCLSLNKALEQLVTQDEQAFAIVPPESSLAHIRSYLENSGGVGVNTGGGAANGAGRMPGS